MIEARTDRLWVRIGDAGDYSESDDLEQLVDSLCELGATSQLERRGEFGVCNNELRGNDYISLYYGPDVQSPVRGVARSELLQLNRMLARESQLEQSKLLRLRGKLATAAQTVYDDWLPEPDNSGGICDAVADALRDVICERLPNATVEDGGHDGDDHAWLIVTINNERFSVDIPAHVYETGGGYNWKKIPDVKFNPADVLVFPL